MVFCCWRYVGVATGGFGCDVLHVTCFMTWKKVLSCCGGLCKSEIGEIGHNKNSGRRRQDNSALNKTIIF